MKKRIIIIDDHQVFRQGLKLVLNRNKNYEVVGDFDNENDMNLYLNNKQADIVLIDIHLFKANGIDIVRRVKKYYPSLKVIMHTLSDDDYNITESRKNGADGYVLKHEGSKTLEKAIDIISDGGVAYLA